MKWDKYDKQVFFKNRHGGALILFPIGDFYECYDEDAETLSKTCGITLTNRNNHKMAGFPKYVLDKFLKTLRQNGIKVGIYNEEKDNTTIINYQNKTTMKVNYLKPGLYYVKSGNQYKQVKIERVKLEFDFNLDEIKERYCGVSGGYNRNELFIDDNGKFPAIPKDVVSTTCYPKINGYAMVDGEIKEVKNASTIIDINEKNERRETLIWQKTDNDVKAYYDIDVYSGEDICRESQSYELIDIDGNKTYRKGLIAEAQLTDEQKEVLDKAISMLNGAGITIVTDYEYGGAYAFNNRNVYSHIQYGPDMEDNEFGAPIREFGHKIIELKTIAEGCEDVIILERK